MYIMYNIYVNAHMYTDIIDFNTSNMWESLHGLTETIWSEIDKVHAFIELTVCRKDR